MVTAYFVPEIASAAHVYFDLSRAFVRAGHEVDVITSYPRRFNLDENDVDKEFLLEETIEGVRVHRCKHPAMRDNIVLRGLEHFLLPRYYFKTYCRIGRTFDVCLVYMPPLPFYYFARKIKRYDGTPSVLNYQDFHPQELTDVGVMRNRLMIRVMEHVERESYKNADYITVLSEGGVEYVVKRGGDPTKIRHIYNGVFLSDFEGYLGRRDFKEGLGLEDKFLVSYAGILSPFQGVDNILDGAKRLGGCEDIVFYVVGDGMLRGHLERRVGCEGISNLELLPLQPREEYFNIINSSDISIVSLDNRMRAPCLPGKLINLMAVKQPVIAMVPEGSETACVIRKAGCGVVVGPGDIGGLADAVLKLRDDVEFREELGENGRRFLEENMNLEKNVGIYEGIFEDLEGMS